MPNPFVHVELNTGDVKAAKKFYRALFDWKLEDTKIAPGRKYTVVDAGKGVGGGMIAKPMPDAPTQWLTYVGVEDLTRSIAKARKLGASVVVESEEVPGMGTLAIIVDPTGATLGLWQPAKKRPSRKAAAKPAAKTARKR